MEKSILHNGLRITYFARKTGSLCLFFIHGAGSNRSIWTPYLRALRKYTCIAVDLRGHGHSSIGELTFGALMDDLKEVLDREKRGKVVVIGNSLGAVLAAELAKERKEVVGVVLASHYSREYARARWLLSPILRVLSKLLKRTHKRKFQDYWKNGNHPLIDFPMLDLRGTHFKDWCAASKASLDHARDVRTINKPTLLFQGCHDVMIKKNKIVRHARENKQIKIDLLSTHHHLTSIRVSQVILEVRQFLRRFV